MTAHLKSEKRYKAIAIPVTFVDGKPRFLTVRDKRFKDWIFIAGGCRKTEINNPLRCALRELEEETRGVISLKSGEYSHFVFETKNRSPEELISDSMSGIDITSVYHVYVFFMHVYKQERYGMIQKFNEEKAKMEQRKLNRLPIKRTYDENDFMSWDTIEEFRTKKQWDTIKYNILENPEFVKAINSLNKEQFNIVKRK